VETSGKKRRALGFGLSCATEVFDVGLGSWALARWWLVAAGAWSEEVLLGVSYL
jgi:hypothetical protein